jgi:hypothetical protein
LIPENHTSHRRVIALTFRVTDPTFRATPLRVRVISKPANYNEIMERKFSCRGFVYLPVDD